MNTHPRIAMYIWRFPPVIGGAEKQCKILAEELAKKGVPVFIVTEKVKGANKREIVNNVRIYRVSSLDWLRRLSFYIKRAGESSFGAQSKDGIIKSVSRLLTFEVPNCYFFLTSLWIFYRKRNDFDIIHIHEAHWIAAFGVRIAKLLNKKAVVKETISGGPMTFKRQPISSQRKAMQADSFIAVSDEILSGLVSAGIGMEKVRRIPNGVQMNSGAGWQYNGSAEQTVVCVSKINQLPHKGIDVLLEAWAIVMRKGPREAKLHILGGGDPFLFRELARSLDIADSVRFPGFVWNVREYLIGSRLFVLPSRAEGMSNALLEAMSAGLPCVATDISGNRDLIDSGTNGLLVPVENPAAMAEAMLFLLNNPAEAIRMGNKAKETINKEYAISAIADRYIRAYKDTMGES